MTGDDLLRRLASYGLPGARPLAAELDVSAGRQLLDTAKPDKLVGLLDQAVADDAIVVPEEVADEIGEAAVAVAAWCVLVERHTLVVHDLLDAAGIEHRFLKGPTIAHRYEPHPGLRTFVDVDVLVPGHDIPAAISTLEAHGHRRNQPEFRPGYDSTWAKSVTMRATTGVEVDVHRVFASGPFGLRASPAPLWTRAAAVVDLGGSAMPCLDSEATCVQACVHATTGTRTHLSSYRDVARLILVADGNGVDDLAAALAVGACVTRAAQSRRGRSCHSTSTGRWHSACRGQSPAGSEVGWTSTSREETTSGPSRWPGSAPCPGFAARLPWHASSSGIGTLPDDQTLDRRPRVVRDRASVTRWRVVVDIRSGSEHFGSFILRSRSRRPRCETLGSGVFGAGVQRIDGSVMRRTVVPLFAVVVAAVLGFVSPAPAGAQTDYGISCTLTVTPPQVSAGASAVVAGNGLQPNFATQVILDDGTASEALLASVVTDGLGNFSTNVTFPAATPPGGHVLTAVCDGTTGGTATTGVTVLGSTASPTTLQADPTSTATTGTDVAPKVTAGIAILGAGAAFVLISRRRRNQAVAG